MNGLLCAVKRNFASGWALTLFMLAAQLPLNALVADLRITEVNPLTNQVEVTNLGTGFTVGTALPFCHRLDYSDVIPGGTTFTTGEAKVFTVGLNDTSSDVWLYTDAANFGDPAKIITGMKYGTASVVGRENEAVTAGKWSAANQFTPAPAAGQTVAWDGVGFSPFDWYLDATPSLGTYPNNTDGAAVATGLAWPSGTEDFETASLGNNIDAAFSTLWPFVPGTSTFSDYFVRVANDVKGSKTPRGSSTQWLRIRDTFLADQNRFYSNTLDAGTTPSLGYRWTMYVNLLTDPPSGGGDIKPRITIQHPGTNAWGIEFAGTGTANQTQINLQVIGTGAGGIGQPGATSSVTAATVGSANSNSWVELVLEARFDTNMVSLSVNGGAAVNLPFDLQGDASQFRFCYRGEGLNNAITMLVDDVSVEQIVPAPVSSGLAWPSGTEDFESAILGLSIEQAITGWALVGGSPGEYEAEISNSIPASGPGGGSTQWLAIEDSDGTNTVLNRVYPNAIIAPVDFIEEYTFEFQMYISALGATSSTLLVSQHNTGAGYQNLAGVRVGPNGVDAVTLGTGSGGIANNGGTTVQSLYNFTDSGGFAQNSWVTLGFTINIPAGTLTAFATGTDMVTQKSTTIGGITFPVPGTDLKNFRFCIRNNGAGNTSTISYDNLSFNGVGGNLPGIATAVRHWELY